MMNEEKEKQKEKQKEESLHLRYYRKTVRQMWLLGAVVILFSVLLSVGLCRAIANQDISDLKQFIQGSKCFCQNLKVEASGNTSNVTITSGDPIQQLAREQLISQGKIKNAGPDVSGTVRSEEPKGSRN